MTTSQVQSAAGSSFRWLTPPSGAVRLKADGQPPVEHAHDDDFHARFAADPRLFCSDLALVTDVDIADGVVSLKWVAAPYCRRNTAGEHCRTLGWNVVLTVDDGTRVVATFRHPSLLNGGLWHLSANEGAEPQDLTATATPDGFVHVGKTAARALHEELGIVADPEQLQQLVTVCAVFEVDAKLGVLLHVPGEMLGWTGEQVLHAHAQASDGWEGTPLVVDVRPEALTSLAAPTAWTAWGLPCLLAVADAPRPLARALLRGAG